MLTREQNRMQDQRSVREGSPKRSHGHRDHESRTVIFSSAERVLRFASEKPTAGKDGCLLHRINGCGPVE